MNPKEYYELTDDQKKRFRIQPDNIPSYKRSVDEQRETTYYVKGASLRFWYNTLEAGYLTHWQTSLEIIFVTEGTYSVKAGDTDYFLEAGDILVIPPGSLHTIEKPEGGSRLIYILELDLFSQIPGFNYILSILTQPYHISFDKDPGLYPDVARMLQKLNDYYWGDSVTKLLHIYSTLLGFFSRLGEHAFLITPIASSVPSKTSSLMGRLSTVLDYIDTHYSENITLEEAAEVACFSKFYFTRLFKQYTNQTFYDYLSAKRIRAAEQMLIIPNLPITEISMKSGFSSLSSFNRTFKRLKGCSPSEYRSLYTSGAQNRTEAN